MKKETRKELHLVCIAVFILCGCEAVAIFLMPYFSAIATLAGIRSAQIVFLVLLLVITPNGAAFAGLSKKNWGTGVKTGLVWSFLFGSSVGVAGFLTYLAGKNPFQLIYSPLPQTNVLVFFLTGGLISPIAEEIFFRGIFYSFLRRLGILAAILISTSVFALFHLSYGTLPVFQIVGGLVFALSFEYSKSIAAPIVIHILGNLAIFSISNWVV